MYVLVFGQLVDSIGNSKIQIDDVNSTTVLKAYLVKKYPSLKNKTFLIAIDNVIVEKEQKIHKQNEIALLPPYSGG